MQKTYKVNYVVYTDTTDPVYSDKLILKAKDAIEVYKKAKKQVNNACEKQFGNKKGYYIYINKVSHIFNKGK